MCIICTTSYDEYKDDTELDCSGCEFLQTIPNMENLTELNCSGWSVMWLFRNVDIENIISTLLYYL